MTDETIRALERQAKDGDPAAQVRLAMERCRAGTCCAHAQDSEPPPVEWHVASSHAEYVPERDMDRVFVSLCFDLPSRQMSHTDPRGPQRRVNHVMAHLATKLRLDTVPMVGMDGRWTQERDRNTEDDA